MQCDRHSQIGHGKGKTLGTNGLIAVALECLLTRCVGHELFNCQGSDKEVKLWQIYSRHL